MKYKFKPEEKVRIIDGFYADYEAIIIRPLDPTFIFGTPEWSVYIPKLEKAVWVKQSELKKDTV